MKFGLFLCVQHPVEDSLHRRLQDTLEQVKLARESGFDMICAGQHYLSPPFQAFQPIPLLARVAAEAGDMMVGATIILLSLHNPVDMAEQVASMDVITGGRFILGVGLGYRDIEYEAFGVQQKDRVPRFLESLELMKRLWTEEEVTFEGRFFQLHNAAMTIKPLQKPHPPIWIAANADAAVKRAARLGYPWAANPHSQFSTIERQAKLYRDTAKEEGIEMPADFPVMKELYVAETHEKAVQEAWPYLEPKYKAYVQWGQDRVLPIGERFDPSFEELARGRFILGDPEECIQQIREHQERLGATWMVLRVQWPGMDNAKTLRAIELIGGRVIPAFSS